ncbi:S1C family serine protease [Sungkyunkwania multivorans]|uniref:S1C family serine protease n=1 Tax=Sungkyunkwania multivorans TaxID=1173618 RepID=A0ABW3CX14_9FLAO
MKKIASLLFVSILGGALTLGAYKVFIEKPQTVVQSEDLQPTMIPTNYPISTNAPINGVSDLDFTAAAEKTVNAVVHVKNTKITSGSNSIFDLFYGNSGRGRTQIGTGSGVIISQDGYIVTNNHVIDGSTEIQVKLNNNKVYDAKLVGADPNTDIALLKIEAEDPLTYIAFGDSDTTKIGEWVLAVGNPFNLTSTVTAGIISAKARDLNEADGKNQAFIQTDAAVNPGNSGGALVNTRGELVGINTAITSQTGSYVGYSFAVPSNIAKKVVEDILEFGNVQKGLLGIYQANLYSEFAEQNGLREIEGVYIGGIVEDSGAEDAGLKEGDVIKRLDNLKIKKFSDLAGYIEAKRPNDVVEVTFERNGKTLTREVTLKKNQRMTIQELGLEVKNPSTKERKVFKKQKGVIITRSVSPYMSNYDLEGKLLVEINGEEVITIEDVRAILQNADPRENTVVVIIDENGERERLIFR